MTIELPEARQPLDAYVPEHLREYRFDLDLARTHKDACAAAAKALREVNADIDGYTELMAYALARVQETKGL